MTTTHAGRWAGRTRRAIQAAVGALATVTLAAACAAGGPASSGGGTGEPHDGGDITFLIDSLGDTWIPNNSSISSFQGHIWGHVADKLVYVDEVGEVSPWIAESWEQDDDATEFTLHLKNGVTFSDGSPLDADAVVKNLDTWAFGAPDAGISPIGLFPKTYDHAEAVDDTTVKVHFDAPTLGFVPTLGYHGSILISPKALALPAEEQADLSNDIGSGPFVVESWKEGDSVVLKKRADYDWGPEAVGHTGPAYLDTITYKLVAESSTRTGAVRSGQADVAYNATPQELDSFKDQGFVVAVPRYLGFVNGYRLNTRVAPFDDALVRQAFQHGIDRDEILSTVYTDDWSPAESLIQSNVPEATDHSDSFAYDPELAASLLDDAGWTEGADGVRTKDGKKLELTLYPNPYLATSKAIDELVAQQLGELGFDVDIQAYDVVTFGERVSDNTSLSNYEVTRSFIDVGTVASILTDAENGEDWFGLGESDPRTNKLRDAVAQATDLDERAKSVDELQEHLLDQAYFAPVTQIVQRIYVQNPELHDVTYNGVAYASYYTAWLED
ncbi:peptide/nickel transport system substrate-binding protein [Promicromonospora sp. AC04]|uniref:ABC transporter substrate-binding protein n=1 Tax=Promicromonospora sp. AC04 TaxID=2135723 RepID=UPI000D3D302D|nr:ABC transporter substrate-binding protein [Promicromonospora sp. AC04]PUB31539.1 peptide/nickel transport system substrate-binding protein [Promicromonospora sp. AC04]